MWHARLQSWRALVKHTQRTSHVRAYTSTGRTRPVRLSALYVPTISAEAVAAADTLESLKLLLRGGYVRQSASGTYTYLTVGLRILQKLTAIIDEEMENVRASRIEMPQLLSSALWHKTGRVQAMGSELFRFKDRRGTEMILAPTHEEEVTRLVGSEIESAKNLPVRVYQIGRKFRDEPRPRAGLLRTKEFLMKDMYSFDVNAEEAQMAYAEVRRAYANIFNRVFDWSHVPGMAPGWLEATADTGAMGGTYSHEFHVKDNAGEDTLLCCSHCGYASNLECATSHLPPQQACHTPEHVRIELYTGRDHTLHGFIVPKHSRLNSLALPTGWELMPLGDERPSDVRTLRLWMDVDCALINAGDLSKTAQNYVAQILGTSLELAEPMQSLHLREAVAGDTCMACGTGELSEHRAIEIGHTFLLGTRYTSALGYGVVPRGAESKAPLREPLQMGCYGIGITRILGALAQRAKSVFDSLAQLDAKPARARAGFVWPRGLAPFSALVLPASAKQLDAAKRLCALLGRGTPCSWDHEASNAVLKVPAWELALDDRTDRSLGSRLFDADLLGYPLVFILGKHWDKTGEVEVRQVGLPARFAQIDGI